MSNVNLYEHDERVHSFGVTVPPWIDSDITAATVAAIEHGGCESGAYMPAVTYYDAARTMDEHGDAVLDFLADCYGDELPTPDMARTCWYGVASFYLSLAVEVWAFNASDALRTAIEARAAFEGDTE